MPATPVWQLCLAAGAWLALSGGLPGETLLAACLALQALLAWPLLFAGRLSWAGVVVTDKLHREGRLGVASLHTALRIRVLWERTTVIYMVSSFLGVALLALHLLSPGPFEAPAWSLAGAVWAAALLACLDAMRWVAGLLLVYRMADRSEGK